MLTNGFGSKMAIFPTFLFRQYRETHIPCDMCSSFWNRRITSNMCFATFETGIPGDMCIPFLETPIPSDVCSPTY